MDVFNLQAKIGLDTETFKATLSNAVSMGVAKIGDFAKQGARYLADFAKDSVSTGMTFDSSMAQVAATMGATIDEMGELRDYAREMGETTAFSASQAADALNYMALAGYDAEQSMAMLPNVLNLAAAGSIDLAYASDMVTDAQSALGLTAEETTDLVDKMATAASNSNTSVSQLGSAILTVGGTAKNLKGGTTELATVLGILADNGIKGAEGGTALRNMLNTLAAPTGDAAITLEQLGVAVYDAEGNMRSLNDVFGDMKIGLSQLTQQERMQAISNIFNVRDMKSAEALLGSVGDRFNELSGAIDNASGAAAKMAETQLDTLAGDKIKFESAFEGVKLAISDALTPSLREATQFGTNFMGKISTALKISDRKAMVKALLNIGKWTLKDITSSFKEIAPEVWDALKEDIFNPIGDAFLDLLPEGMKDNVKSIFTSISNFANNVDFAKIGNALSGLGDTLGGVATTISGGIAWAFENVLSPLGTWFMNSALPVGIDLVSAAFDNIKNVFDMLAPIAKPVWDEFLSPLFSTIGELTVGSLDMLAGALRTIADTFKDFDTNGFIDDIANGNFFEDWKIGMSGIGETIDEFGGVIDDFFSANGAAQKWNEFWQNVGGLVFYAKEQIVYSINQVIDVIDKVVNKIEGHWDFWEGFGGYLADKFNPTIDSNADGGYVTTPRLSWVAEKEPEYIIPESKMDKVFKNGGSGYTFNFYYQGGNGMTDAEIEEQAKRLAELSIAQIRAVGGTGF